MLTSDGSNLLYASNRPQLWAMSDAAGIGYREASGLSAHDMLSLLDRRDSALNTEMQEEQSRQSSEDTPQATGDVTGEDDECYDPYGERTSEETGALGMVGIGLDVEQQIQADQTVVRSYRRQIMYDIYKRLLETVQQGHMFYIDAPGSYFAEGDDVNRDELLGQSSDMFSSFQGGAAGQTPGAGAQAVAEYTAELLDEMTHDDAGQSASEQAAAMEGGFFGGNMIPVAAAGAHHPEEGDTKRIYYFYLGDLLDAALDLLKSEDNPRDFGDIRLVLGTFFMNLPNARGGKTILVNLADVPISLNLFLQFFTDRVISRARTEWPLREFIREVMSVLIYPAIGSGCADRPSSPRPNIDTVHVSAYGDDEGNDRLLTAGETNPTKDF